jgi:hypothetical protein
MQNKSGAKLDSPKGVELTHGRRAHAEEQTVGEAIRAYLAQGYEFLHDAFVAPKKPDRVGDYTANYTLPTEEALKADDPDLVELFNNSKVISKRES